MRKGESAPRMVAFNGKAVYEQFAQRRGGYGLQKELLYGAKVFVVPATNGLHAPVPKEKLSYFRKLAQLVRRTEKARDAVASQ
jgi:hypothetical protein